MGLVPTSWGHSFDTMYSLLQYYNSMLQFIYRYLTVSVVEFLV